ncbi:hypothetical protein SERLA73DRAFT_191149 [Serpula lacrymans var. lacrymans S7.3]|uniref:Man1/Src1 C-terminal domain-containing protein n=2 Tax=Serpula lacrymans var. lacrymans TaxID=341189 RepID=F8QGZ3_SERL3|nr:uncharacterized protein SERLADRAFT_480761 [Serpula lacrymans var. lacrymans S7.9]EGN92475.1 hypothetical protein SERLA73DRAFT_191149 [Serpula lacrymans var. lacrymans S7.3]EGO18602.1 hypothetical protein SERLADRAFT_480761 [Serpula lacrymans var. lacrymans S7.9]
MSRSLTAAQVIGLGEYLDPDFDPSSLTVSQLLGILGYHNIKFPTPYTKPKLVELFNDEVKRKAAKFRKDRLKKENSIASDDGITDGVTGRPIGQPKNLPARRSSRRLSRAPTEDEDLSPVRQDPPKRRRSSAQPSLGGPSTNRVAPQPALMEESEPEEEELPARKVVKNKKSSQAAGSKARRISETFADDSGWEDNNIFQSGAESSSPVRPSHVKPKTPRKSVGGKRTRHSMSAPPQISPPKAPKFEEYLQRSPPQSKFEPQLPPEVVRPAQKSPPSTRKTSFTPIEHQPSPSIQYEVKADNLDNDQTSVELDDVDYNNSQEEEALEFDDIDAQTIAISQRIAGGGAISSRASSPKESSSFLLRFIIGIIILAVSGTVVNYKMESAPIGYCDVGSNTNRALEDFKMYLEAVDSCNRNNRTLLYGQSDVAGNVVEGKILCPPPSLIPLPHPSSCTPCPEYAKCTQHTVTCMTGYLLHPHPLHSLLSPFSATAPDPVEALWKFISGVADGLPGLGPKAFPSRCLEDPKRKRNIGVLGKAIEALLGQERGRRLCAGEKVRPGTVEGEDRGEAIRWGLEVEALRENMKRRTAPHLLETFDDTFNEAIQQLVQWGGVILGEDSAGNRYLAHKTPNLTWTCQVTVKTRELWEQWRTTLFTSTITIIIALYGRKRRDRRQVENKRVAELVQIALDTLRNQELAYHTDPVTAPHPFLSSLQLRDLILQDEHSIPVRRRLWDQVERVVEGNSNVRANLEEVRGGDEMRVWRWVGTAGREPKIRKRVQGAEQKDEEKAD